MKYHLALLLPLLLVLASCGKPEIREEGPRATTLYGKVAAIGVFTKNGDGEFTILCWERHFPIVVRGYSYHPNETVIELKRAERFRDLLNHDVMVIGNWDGPKKHEHINARLVREL